MKRCPECRRDYFDDSLQYCLDDGAALLEGPGSFEPATAILPEAHTPGEARTRTYDSIAATPQTASKRNSIVAGAIGILVITALGIGSYFYFGRTAATEINAIAVLPFVNESGNPELEYLTDGMTDTLINNLSKIPKLSVKARSSVFRYKGKDVEPQKVASDLNVQAFVNGRVMQKGDNLTLNLEVVDARTGDQVWGEQYVRKVGDLVALQSDIARDVSGKLRQKLSGADTERVSKRGTENAEAYEQYLRGRFHWNKRTIEDINKSIEYFQKAIELDPAYALAYAGLADSYVTVPSYTNDRSKEFYPKARSAAMKALEIDDSLAQAHATLGCVLHEFDWKFEEAEKEFKRALEIDPNYATGHQWYAELLLTVRRYDDALAEINRALESDPLSLIINSMTGLVHALLGDNARAESQLKRTIEMDPNFGRAHLHLANVYEDEGKFEEAIGEYEKLTRINGASPEEIARGWGAVRQAYRANGENGYWKAFATIAIERHKADPDTGPSHFALGYLSARAGDLNRAYEYFEQSFEQREPDILRLFDPNLDPIRADPRFENLVRRIGLPQKSGA